MTKEKSFIDMMKDFSRKCGGDQVNDEVPYVSTCLWEMSVYLVGVRVATSFFIKTSVLSPDTYETYRRWVDREFLEGESLPFYTLCYYQVNRSSLKSRPSTETPDLSSRITSLKETFLRVLIAPLHFSRVASRTSPGRETTDQRLKVQCGVVKSHTLTLGRSV